MASKVQFKRSSVEGKVPLITDLDLGELAINTFDGKVYLKKNDGTDTIVDITAATSVDVVVRNETGSTVPAGTVIYLSGASGNKALLALAQANSESTSTGTYAVTKQSIANNQNGLAVIVGQVAKLNTSTYTAGQVLWLSPTTAGAFTTTKPVAPNHAVYVAIVTRSSTTQGTIEVKIQNGYELDELHNVLITTAADGEVLAYEASTGLWKNKPAVSGAVNSFNTRTGAITLTSGDVTAALGFTPYSSTNPSGYITSNALTPYLTAATASSTYLPLTGGNLTDALSITGGSANATYTSTQTKFADGSIHAMKTVPGGVFEAIRAMNLDTTVGTTVRLVAAATSDAFNNTNGGKVFIDAVRSAANNMDLVFSLNDIPGGAPLEKFRFYGGGAFNAVGAITQNGNQVLHAGNYTSYSPSLTGTGASGTWGISITGNAATVSSITSSQVTTALGFTPYNSTNPSGYITSSFSGFMLRSTAPQTNPNTNFASSAYRFDPNANNPTNEHYAVVTYGNEFNVVGQLATHFQTGQTFTRAFNASWSVWRTLLDSSNYTSYSPTLTGSGASGTWGISITGSAATLTTSRTIGMTGDVTWTSASFNGSANVTGTATLANSGVTAGTYTKVTVDAKGRVTTGTTLASADLPTYTGTLTSSQVTTALGFTPMNVYNGASAASYDTLTTNGVWRNQGGLNGPSGTTHTTLLTALQGDANYGWQLSSTGSTLYVRDKSTTWTSWRTLIDSTNYNSYAPTLTGTGASGTWGINITGNAATTSQRSFSGDISAGGQGRFTGWYTGNAATGSAVEIGMASGQGYLNVYNRDTATYGILNIVSSSAHMQFNGSIINVISGALQQAGNQVLHAGNYSSYALPLSGGAITGNVTFGSLLKIGTDNTDWGTGNYLRGSTNHLVIGVQSGGTLYVNYGNSGGTVRLYGASLLVNDTHNLLHSGNYSSYALPLSGGTMSGAIFMQGTQRVTHAGFAGIEYWNNGAWQVYIGSENNAAGARFNSANGVHTWYNNSTQAMQLSGSNLNIVGTLTAATKSFLIPHPTKPGMKLQYGSLEGPENGVYVRGKLVGSNTIHLPDYWLKLVDPDTITVTLTPIGKPQNLWVASIDNNVVVLEGNTDISCHYVVYAERVDVAKLKVEFYD